MILTDNMAVGRNAVVIMTIAIRVEWLTNTSVYVCGRIVDNLPITWCYLTENSQTYCSTGFPIGCFNKKTGANKDGCSYLVQETFHVIFTV